MAFGPHPRDYSFSIPKKKHRVAFYGALAAKIQNGDVIVIEPFEMPEPKTKEIAKMLLDLLSSGGSREEPRRGTID